MDNEAGRIMIPKRELLDIAAAVSLNPHVVEKDYALGWALAGIFAHEELADSWVFKGGTCLKKCFFETYRFSEDLDFTLTDETHLREDFLRRVFTEIAEWIYEQCGLEFLADSQDFDIYENPRGKLNCQGKLSYRGPVSPRSGGLPRIKLDLTADERLVLPPVRVPIFHPYSDAPGEPIEVLAYAYEEAFAEKVRALCERTRPRDLYDVVNLFRNTEARPSAAVLVDVLRQKCAFKGIDVPRDGDFDGHRGDLEGAWGAMLAHQLPALPPLDAFWDTLPEFFAWLSGVHAPQVPASYTLARGDTVIRERTLRLPLRGTALSSLELIRFAAANRLCVDLDYGRKTRRIEPYSLRRTQDDNFVLHAWSVAADAHRSYRVDRIEGARSTGQNFTPRYEVELTPAGPLPVQDTGRTGRSGLSGGYFGASARRASSSYGPTYVYECSYCSKRFNRKSQTTTLNPHKDKSGYPCAGRYAHWVDTRY
jgi:predicted nucleotidyltransferase component of viral defense system